MKITVLGGAREVGKSAFLVESTEGNALLDFGVQLSRPPAFPMHIQPKDVDSILLSHAHLDHSGGIPLFFISNGCKLYTTDLTLELTKLLLEDFLKISGFYLPYEYLDILSMINKTHKLKQSDSIDIKGFNTTFLNAGHLPGSSSIILSSEGKRLLYTGDINAKDTVLLKGADTDFGELDFIITESTYSATNHLPRIEVEKDFIDFAKEVVERGGTFFVPAFSVGRAQEMACLFKKYNFPHQVCMDGMALKTNEILSRYSEYLNDPELFHKSIKNIELIRGWKQRRKVVNTPSVIISPAGMLVGGASVFYNNEISKRPKNAISLVSYQIEGTPGRTLLDKKIAIINGKPKKVKAEVRHFDFSSHSGKKELLDMFKNINGSPKILTVHGEERNCTQFAEDLRIEFDFDATAPQIGDVFKF